MTMSTAHMTAEANRFRRPGEIAFEHVYLGEALTDDEVDTVLTALRDGADPATVGQRLLVAGHRGRSSILAVDSQFGVGFSGALASLEPGVWDGPVRSGYGVHVARVAEIVPA